MLNLYHSANQASTKSKRSPCLVVRDPEKKAICGVKCLDQAHTLQRRGEGNRTCAEDQWISQIR